MQHRDSITQNASGGGLGDWEAWTLFNETLWAGFQNNLPPDTACTGELSKLLQQVTVITICELLAEREACFK